MQKKSLYFIIFLLIVSCAKKQKSAVVIRIGSEKVTTEDITQRIRNAQVSYQEYLATESGKKQFVDIILKQKIMIVLAKRTGLGKSKDIKNALKEFKEDYSAKLKQYEEELLIQAYLKELENTDLRITDTEIENYYKSHSEDFKSPTEVRLSHILLASEAEAKKAIDRLASGKEFEDLAKEISLDPETSVRGGDLGTFKSSQLLPEFVDVVKNLKVGEIARKPVKTNFGYHILKKTAQKLLPAVKIDEAKREVRQLILKDKFDKWLSKQKQELNVKVDYSAFELKK